MKTETITTIFKYHGCVFEDMGVLQYSYRGLNVRYRITTNLTIEKSDLKLVTREELHILNRLCHSIQAQIQEEYTDIEKGVERYVQTK